MKIRVLIVILLCSYIGNLTLAGEGERALEPYSGKIIRNISLVRLNVFDDKISDNPPFYYRWANSLHILTKESVIRRELLFGPGDSLNVKRLIETERNLRLAGYLGEVQIAPTLVSGDSVDLTVTTTDLWTSKVDLYYDLAGGNYNLGVGLTEGNVLGFGKLLQLSVQNGEDQDGFDLYYLDNRLFNSRLALNLGYVDFTYSRGLTISLSRPQYSLKIPYGFKALFSNVRTRPRLFSHGVEYFVYRYDQDLFSFESIYTFGEDNRISILPGYDFQRDIYSVDQPDSPINASIPQNETFSYPSIGISASAIRFGLERFLDAAGNPEDMTYGAALKYKIGRSDKAFDADFIGWYQSLSGQFLTKPKDRLYVGGLDKVTWWNRNGQAERIRHFTEAAIYYKPAVAHTLILHARTDFAWRQKSTYQVILGGGNGLRGFSIYEFSGNRLAQGNLEYRFYLPLEILTVRIGGAAFYDIGNVWRRSENIDLGRLMSDVGIGLRLGLTKSSTARVIHVDFARSINSSDYYITIGSTAAFSLNFANVNQ